MNDSLFDVLNKKFGVSDEEYKKARDNAREQNLKIGAVLIKKNVVTETQLLEAVGEMYDLPFLPSLPREEIDLEFTSKVQIQFLKKYHMVPLMPVKNGDTPPLKTESGAPSRGIIAVNDPTCHRQLDDLKRLLGIENSSVVLASRSNIVSAINMAYDRSRGSAQQLVEDMEENGRSIISEIKETADLLDDTSESQIIKLVNHIISQSIKARASDIHIEPYQDSFKVRYRVDGILYDLLTPPKWIQAALISRIKVMGKLNIAEKRLPQDGRIDVRIGEQDVDIRVSTVPTTYGERVVMRLLNKSSSLLSLSEFGMKPADLSVLENLIRLPNGIILVTGPTGSGKTTSLYAMIASINSADRNIITVEDPVEYQMKGVGQIQVNRKIGLTFAKGLRSIVRQDPDVILVGEIRDKETAEIAVQSALTGHLVFSTLHTNDAASAVTRLVDIGIEPFLLSSALKAVVAQRLIRGLCHECKEEYRPDQSLLDLIHLKEEHEDITFYRARGCEKCFDTGYKGRQPIFEMLVINDQLKRTILKTSDANLIKAQALRSGMRTLGDDGIRKIIEGVTTIEEVLRVTHI